MNGETAVKAETPENEYDPEAEVIMEILRQINAELDEISRKARAFRPCAHPLRGHQGRQGHGHHAPLRSQEPDAALGWKERH